MKRITSLILCFVFGTVLSAEVVITDQGFIKVYDEKQVIETENIKADPYIDYNYKDLIECLKQKLILQYVNPKQTRYIRPKFYTLDDYLLNYNLYQKAFGYKHEFPNYSNDAKFRYYPLEGKFYLVPLSVYKECCCGK